MHAAEWLAIARVVGWAAWHQMRLRAWYACTQITAVAELQKAVLFSEGGGEWSGANARNLVAGLVAGHTADVNPADLNCFFGAAALSLEYAATGMGSEEKVRVTRLVSPSQWWLHNSFPDLARKQLGIWAQQRIQGQKATSVKPEMLKPIHAACAAAKDAPGMARYIDVEAACILAEELNKPVTVLCLADCEVDKQMTVPPVLLKVYGLEGGISDLDLTTAVNLMHCGKQGHFYSVIYPAGSVVKCMQLPVPDALDGAKCHTLAPLPDCSVGKPSRVPHCCKAAMALKLTQTAHNLGRPICMTLNVVCSCYALALLCSDGEEWSHRWEEENETEASWLSVVRGGWLCHWAGMEVQQHISPNIANPYLHWYMQTLCAGRKLSGGGMSSPACDGVGFMETGVV
jgi:hypothetical protein